MIKQIPWRLWVILCLIVLLVLWFVFTLHDKQEKVLGIPIVSQSESVEYIQNTLDDQNVKIMYNNAVAALDKGSNTLYLSVSDDVDSLWDVTDVLSSGDVGVRLYFVEDNAMNDLRSAVKIGHSFRLIAKSLWGNTTVYDVIFTTLPVVSMTTVTSTGEGINEIFTGQFVLWDPKDETLVDHRVTQSTAKWHYRGRATLYSDKKSYRLSTKTKTGDKENSQLLDLGYDDDWIVNAVVSDRTKLREPVISSLWNKMQESRDYNNLLMSQGRYIELVCDGIYQGIYYLQRRVDGKFLNIGAEDTLFEGANSEAEGIWGSYRLRDYGENMNSVLSYALCESFYEGQMYDAIDLDNWIDVALLIQIGYLMDNANSNNMYYLFHKEGDKHIVQFVPWDVDLSFGYCWNADNGRIYDVENCYGLCNRTEYDELRAIYPDLERRLAERWIELRKDVVTIEHFKQCQASFQVQLDASGAFEREQALWAYLYDEEDTTENMLLFLEKRLPYLDNYYAQFLNENE